MDTENQKKTWYWSKNGVKQGPVTEEEMRLLVASGEIDKETSVWNGEGNWVTANKSHFRQYFQKNPPTGEPGVVSGLVDNKYVWMVALVPVVGMIAELLARRELIWLYLVLNVAILFFDQYKLQKQGFSAPQKWWVILVPVYLWKRAELLDHSKNYVYAWVAAFVLTIPLSGWINQRIVADAACEAINETRDDFIPLLGRGTECKLVTITKEAVRGFYKAKALLSTGNELDIVIEEKKGEIHVRVVD